MGLTPKDLRALLDAFENSTWQEMTVAVGGDSLYVSRRVSSESAVSAPLHVAGVSVLGRADGHPSEEERRVESPASLAGAPLDAVPGSHTSAATPVKGGSGVDTGRSEAAAESRGGVVTDSPKGTPVLAPSVGLFWHSPSPGAPPFVEVGTRVAPEDTIGILEVMKLMNRVPAGVAGIVTAVLVDNGDMVEHGDPLVLIDADA